jgi:two-component system chemotaxis response regulator CheB
MLTIRHDIIVIGASAGGPKALSHLLSQLPAGFPAAVFIVNHIAPDISGRVLLDGIAKDCALPCKFPEHGEFFRPAQVYLAPPDHQMLLKDKQILVTHGPHENRSRPAIDPLFRSAAAYHNARVIGIILSGMLDDGTAGLLAIRRSGGIAVIQEPNEAEFSAMPLSALHRVGADHCVTVKAMGPLLLELINLPVNAKITAPAEVVREAQISERIHSDINEMEELGERVPYSCPDCGGALWEVKNDPNLRFRCHAGHAYSAEIYFRQQSEKLEETIWVALRMMEEQRHMLSQLSERERRQGLLHLASQHQERANATQVHIDRLRDILMMSKQPDFNQNNLPEESSLRSSN